VTPPTPAPTEVVSTPPAVVTPQPQRVAPGAVTEPTQVRGAVAPPAMPPLRSQAFAAAPLTTRPEHYLALIPPAVAETPASYAAGSSAPPVLATSETEIAANPRITTPTLPTFAREQVVEQPTLAGASLVKLGGQHGPIGRYAATDMDYTISPRSTYSGHILRAPDAIAEPPVTSLEATQPVEIKRPVPHYGGLAVVRKPAPAADTTAPTPIVPTEIRTTAPQRETTGATTAKAVAPETQVTVQRPVIPPTLAATQSAPVAPQSATAIERDRQLTATYAAAAKTTPPEYVAPQPVTGPATPVTLPNRTSTAVAQADAALTTAGQHTSMPQYIQPLPTAARSAAEADATIPTFAMLTKVMPGSGLVSAQSPQRTSAPQKISLAPMTPRPEPAAPKVTELPALAAGNAVPVKTDHSKLVMLPRTEAPRLSDTGCTTTPGQPELAAAIAKSPVKDISIVYNGKTLDLRAAPETANGIATGPLRELFEQSDGLLYWFPITKEVRAIGPETNLHLTIGNPEVDLNGTRQQVPVAPYIKQGRTMLPLQFIADTLELTITYEPDTQQIVITTSEF